MIPPPIYTIGYGGRKIDVFLDLLKHFEITILIDIRSSPTSRFRPDYRKKALRTHLAQAGIQHLFIGDVVGDRPSDPACYTDGNVDYEKLQNLPFYQAGIARQRQTLAAEMESSSLGSHIYWMCSEAKPQACHRNWLVGQTLTAEGIEVLHIDETGQLQTHASVLINLLH